MDLSCAGDRRSAPQQHDSDLQRAECSLACDTAGSTRSQEPPHIVSPEHCAWMVQAVRALPGWAKHKRWLPCKKRRVANDGGRIPHGIARVGPGRGQQRPIVLIVEDQRLAKAFASQLFTSAHQHTRSPLHTGIACYMYSTTLCVAFTDQHTWRLG